MRWSSFSLIWLMTVAAVAQEPPVPKPAPVALTAPKEVSGTGKKLDPFVFTVSTRCVLTLSGGNDSVRFDVDDAPTDLEILDNKYATFSLFEDGLFQLTAHGGDVYSKVWFQIKSGTDPPPPGPGPGPEPGPVDPPAPQPSPLWVVIVKDGATLSKLPASQLAALTSAKIREYCDSHCRKGTDGKTPEFKLYEKDTEVTRQSPAIQKAFQTAVEDMRKANSTGPWLAISNGTAGYSGPLPLTESAVLEKLKEYGGP